MASSSRFVRELLECRDDNFALRDNKNARMGKMSYKPKYEVKPEHLRVGGIGVYGGEVATTKTTSVIGPTVDALAISAALAGINNETAAMNIQHPIEQHHPHQQQQHHQQQPQHHEQQQQHQQQQQQQQPQQQQLYKCNECGSRWANLKTFRMHQRKHKEQKQEEEKYVMQEFQASTQNVVPPNLNTNISSDIPKPNKKPRRAQHAHAVHQVVTQVVPQQQITTQVTQQQQQQQQVVTVTTAPQQKEAPRFVPNNVPVKDTPPVPCGPTLKCSECGTRWGNNLTFRKHKERKSTPNFCCPVCELKCWSRCELSYHLMTHREGDIFVCTMCGYRAGTKIHLLKEHMNAEHEGEMEPPPPPQPPQQPQQQQQQQQQQTSAGGGSSAYFDNV